MKYKLKRGAKKCDLFHSYVAIVSMPKACCRYDIQCIFELNQWHTNINTCLFLNIQLQFNFFDERQQKEKTTHTNEIRHNSLLILYEILGNMCVIVMHTHTHTKFSKKNINTNIITNHLDSRILGIYSLSSYIVCFLRIERMVCTSISHTIVPENRAICDFVVFTIQIFNDINKIIARKKTTSILFYYAFIGIVRVFILIVFSNLA